MGIHREDPKRLITVGIHNIIELGPKLMTMSFFTGFVLLSKDQFPTCNILLVLEDLNRLIRPTLLELNTKII